MRQRDRHLVAVGARDDETHRLSCRDRNLSILDRSDPNFRSLQVLQDTDRAADLLFERANRGMDLGVILVNAMAEVQPERIDAGEKERLQHVGRATRGSDGGDDFGPAIASHGSVGPLAASGDQNESDIVDIVPVGPVRTRPPIPSKKLKLS